MDGQGTASPSGLLDSGASTPPATTAPTPGAAAPPPTGTVIDASSGVSGEWYGGMSEEYRNEPTIQSFKNIDGLAKSYLESRKMMGSMVKLPGEDATPDEISKVYNKLGRPETADGYEIKAPTIKNEAGEEIPIFNLDESAAASARESFHKLNLTPTQVQGVMELYGQQRIADMGDAQGLAEQEQIRMAEESESTLRQEWGDKYDINLSIARKAAEKFDIMEDVKELGLGNSAQVIKMLHTLSDHIGEAKLTGDFSASGGGFEETLESIDRKMNEIGRGHQDYAKLNQQRINLYKQRYSNQ